MKKYAILLLLLTLALTCAPSETGLKFDYKEYRLMVLQYSELNLANVKEYVKLADIKHPEKVVAQFILETGWGKSHVCKKYNNLFGFRNTNGYMKYNHWTKSVESYKKFQDKKYKGGDYYTFLVKIGYAEAGNYIQVLKTIKIKV